MSLEIPAILTRAIDWLDWHRSLSLSSLVAIHILLSHLLANEPNTRFPLTGNDATFGIVQTIPLRKLSSSKVRLGIQKHHDESMAVHSLLFLQPSQICSDSLQLTNSVGSLSMYAGYFGDFDGNDAPKAREGRTPPIQATQLREKITSSTR